MEEALYTFPTIEDGVIVIEHKLCDMIKRYRNNDLAPEEKDWMDWANNTLTSA